MPFGLSNVNTCGSPIKLQVPEGIAVSTSVMKSSPPWHLDVCTSRLPQHMPRPYTMDSQPFVARQ